jgi:hypothetical protein
VDASRKASRLGRADASRDDVQDNAGGGSASGVVHTGLGIAAAVDTFRTPNKSLELRIGGRSAGGASTGPGDSCEIAHLGLRSPPFMPSHAFPRCLYLAR